MSTQNLGISAEVDFNELNKYYSEIVAGIDFNDGNIDNKEVNNHGDYQKSHVLHRNDVCQNCGGDQLIEDHTQGIVICTNKSCGEVLRAVVDNNPEWKQYDDNDKANARCSQSYNPLLPRSSLGTTISGFGKSRVKVLHIWAAMPYKERSLNNEFKKIHDVCQKYDILKCVEDDTKIMYKMVSECKHTTGKNKGRYVITRGINRKSIIAGCLFFACLRKGVTRTSKEIAEMWGITDMEMNRGCKNLQKLFKIRNKNNNSKTVMNMGSSKPEHFIKRYCNELKIKNQYIEEALKIAINVEKLNLASSHTPYSSAAASILLMAELNNLTYITKKKLALEFNISDATIYSTYKELEPYKCVLTNCETTDRIVKQLNNDLATQTVPPEVLARMQKFGIQSSVSPNTSQTNLSGIQNDIKNDTSDELENIECDNSDDESDIELDLDYDDQYLEEEYFKELEQISNDLPILLKEKHTQINKLLSTKTKDISKDIEILKRSHNLIKEITKDLGRYADHLNMFD